MTQQMCGLPVESQSLTESVNAQHTYTKKLVWTKGWRLNSADAITPLRLGEDKSDPIKAHTNSTTFPHHDRTLSCL